MNNFKFTGTNIAAALLIIAYLFPWISAMGISMSGFSITSNGIAPGLMAYFVNGLSRLFMILALLVPLCGAVILYQNVTGNTKFIKYYKPAFIVPFIFLIVGAIGLYFKMKPEAYNDSDAFGNSMRRTSQAISDLTPGALDILSFGFYLSLAAAIYLLLVRFGKVKDKEYYKPSPTVIENKPPSGLE